MNSIDHHTNTHNTQINLNKTSSENPRSTSNQSSKPCTVLQYLSRTAQITTKICLCCRVLQCGVMCCSALQCVALCGGVLQCGRSPQNMPVLHCGAMCCSVQITTKTCLCSRVLHCGAMCCSVLQCVAVCCTVLQCVDQHKTCLCCRVLHCGAMCYSVLQCVAVCGSVWQCVAVCCSVLRCVAVGCSVLQCVQNITQYLQRQCFLIDYFYRALLQMSPMCTRLFCVSGSLIGIEIPVHRIFFFGAKYRGSSSFSGNCHGICQQKESSKLELARGKNLVTCQQTPALTCVTCVFVRVYICVCVYV